jgi:hypothetical protein
MAYFTKEMGGTLLIVTKDDRTYEVSRSITSNNLIIRPDADTPNPSSSEEMKFKKLYKLSNCYTR